MIQNLKQELKKKKYKYIFLLTIIVLGIISGIILSNILSYNDKKLVAEKIEHYFTSTRLPWPKLCRKFSSD